MSPVQPLRDGYQPYSPQTFSPLQQPGQFMGAFGSKPSSAAPQQNDQNQQQQPPAPSRTMAPSSGPNDATPSNPGGGTTFAQLQAAGIPRPAPPPSFVPPSAPADAHPSIPYTQGPGAVGGGVQLSTQPWTQIPGYESTDPNMKALSEALAKAGLAGLNNPAGYGSNEVMQSYNRLSGQIDDSFNLQRRQTDEQMAGRGLYDSSFAAGRLSDLNVGQRSAKTELGAQLLEKQAQQQQSDRASAIASALGIQGQSQDFQLGNRRIDVDSELGQNQNLLSLLNVLSSLGYVGPGGSTSSATGNSYITSGPGADPGTGNYPGTGPVAIGQPGWRPYDAGPPTSGSTSGSTGGSTTVPLGRIPGPAIGGSSPMSPPLAPSFNTLPATGGAQLGPGPGAQAPTPQQPLPPQPAQQAQQALDWGLPGSGMGTAPDPTGQAQRAAGYIPWSPLTGGPVATDESSPLYLSGRLPLANGRFIDGRVYQPQAPILGQVIPFGQKNAGQQVGGSY